MALDFDTVGLAARSLNESHQQWRVHLRRFADIDVAAFAGKRDEADQIPYELWHKAREVGLLIVDGDSKEILRDLAARQYKLQ